MTHLAKFIAESSYFKREKRNDVIWCSTTQVTQMSTRAPSVSLRLHMTHLAKLMTESSDFKREKEMMFYGVQTQVTQISTRAPSVSLHLHMTRLAKLIAESSDFNRGEIMLYGVQTHKLPR